MPALDRSARDVISEVTPYSQRGHLGRSTRTTADHGRSMPAPGTGCAGAAVLSVVVSVDAGGGPILLADGMRMFAVAEHGGVGGAVLFGERLGWRTPLGAERVRDYRVGRAGEEPLGKWFGLGEQRPGPEGESHSLLGLVPDDVDR